MTHTRHLSLFILSFIIPTGYGTRFGHPSGFRLVLCFYLSMFVTVFVPVIYYFEKKNPPWAKILIFCASELVDVVKQNNILNDRFVVLEDVN